MGSGWHDSTRSAAEGRETQHELLHSLRAAVDTLSLCVARIEELITGADRQLGTRPEPSVALGPEPTVARVRAQVSVGSGASVIGSREPDSSAGERGSSSAARRSLDGDGSLGFRQSLIGSNERRRTADRRAADRRTGRGGQPSGVERRETGPRASEQRSPGTPALMMATELAHLGYNREEIGERLRARWGERAAAILREALD